MAELTKEQALAKARARLRLQEKNGNVVAEVKDGKVYRMQDGSLSFKSPGYATNDQDIIKRLMEGESAQAVVQSGFDRQTIGQAPVASRAVKAMEGVPFIGSYLDEAVGAVYGDKATQGVRAVSGAMERERPGQSTALQIGGGVAGSIPMAVAAVPGLAAIAPASRIGRTAYGLLAGIGAGATEGSIYGAGEGETIDERASNAERQAKTGAVIGGILGGLGPSFADLTDAAVKALKKSDVSQIAKRFGLSKPAAKVVKQHVDSGDIASARQAIQRAGDDAMLGEATQGARSLLDATAAMGGRAGEIVNDAVESRVARGNTAFRAASDEAMGKPPQGLMSAADEIAERTRPVRNAAYERAFNTPINYASQSGRRVEEVLGLVPPKVLRDAIADANEDMLAREAPRSAQILADIADDGTVRFRQLPNVKQLDELKKALQRIAYKNTDDFGRLDGTGQRYNELAGKLRDAVSEATDGTYGQAVAIGGDKIAEDTALKLGTNLMRDNVTRDEVIRTMAGASADQRNAARVGFRNAINEMMDNVRTVASDRNVEAREVKRLVDRLSSKAMRDKARIVLGPTEADKFFKEVDRITSGLNLRAAVSENSRTARRQAIQGTIDEASAPNVLQSAAAGEPIDSAKRVVQLLTGETPASRAFRREGVAEEVASFLTTQKGKSAEAALNYINRAMDGQRLTDAQAKFVANVLATTGFLAGGREGQRYLAPSR